MAIDIPNQVLARAYLDELVELIGAKAAGNFIRTFAEGISHKEIGEKLKEKIKEVKNDQPK